MEAPCESEPWEGSGAWQITTNQTMSPCLLFSLYGKIWSVTQWYWLAFEGRGGLCSQHNRTAFKALSARFFFLLSCGPPQPRWAPIFFCWKGVRITAHVWCGLGGKISQWWKMMTTYTTNMLTVIKVIFLFLLCCLHYIKVCCPQWSWSPNQSLALCLQEWP